MKDETVKVLSKERFGDQAVFGQPMAVLAQFGPISKCLVSNNTGSLGVVIQNGLFD